MSDRIIVTGGAGYIGSHTVVELIQSGYIPVIIDNFSNADTKVIERLKEITGEEIICYEGDCLDMNFLNAIVEREGEIGSIIHFAASKAVGESVEKPLDYYQNNLMSLINLLRLSQKNEIRNFVFSSSCTVYGEPDELPVTEETPRKKAESPYGNTKKVGEDIIEDFVNSIENMRAVSLRYFNPIGAHPSGLIGELPLGVPSNLVPYVTQTAIGIRDQLTVFGDDYDTPDGTCIRDFIHVIDIAKAHVKAVQYLDDSAAKKLYDVFNLGTGKGNSVMEVINTFEEISGVKLNYSIGPRRSGDVEKVYANAQKSNKVLGWKSEFNLKNALVDAWNWQQKLPK